MSEKHSKKKIACVLGTRPEIIKFRPIIEALRQSRSLEPVVISSGQHRELADIALETFNFTFDVDLKLMREDQAPADFLGALLPELSSVLGSVQPAAVLVQGDTTTALGGALSAFHLKLPVGHIEAGLRTGELYSPFPEEMNRRLISGIAAFNFCPTSGAKTNLIKECCPGESFVVGNTVVDAALQVKAALDHGGLKARQPVERILSAHEPVIFVTGHRRENFDEPLKNLCTVLRRLTEQRPSLAVMFPVHPNPNVKRVVIEELNSAERIFLIDPIDYASSIAAISRSALIISDSGGIQEEAPSFGTPVIVTREFTERPEGLEAGTSFLCPLTAPDVLFEKALALLDQGRRTEAQNPFGDGQSAVRIVRLLEEKLAE